MKRHPYENPEGACYWFRSKTERTFALHLDIVGVEWFYEPVLYHGSCFYIPDFYIPSRKLFLEIKGGNDHYAHKLQGYQDMESHGFVLGHLGRDYIAQVPVKEQVWRFRDAPWSVKKSLTALWRGYPVVSKIMPAVSSAYTMHAVPKSDCKPVFCLSPRGPHTDYVPDLIPYLSC